MQDVNYERKWIVMRANVLTETSTLPFKDTSHFATIANHPLFSVGTIF